MFADQIAIRPGNRHASLCTTNLYRIKTKQTAFTLRASERRTAGQKSIWHPEGPAVGQLDQCIPRIPPSVCMIWYMIYMMHDIWYIWYDIYDIWFDTIYDIYMIRYMIRYMIGMIRYDTYDIMIYDLYIWYKIWHKIWYILYMIWYDIWCNCQLQFCWHPMARVQYTFTHKQYTVQQCSTHLHTNSTQYNSAAHIYAQTVHSTAVQHTFTHKQYTVQQCSTHLHTNSTQYSSAAHIYTQTVHRTTQLTTLVGRLSGIRTQNGQNKIDVELTA
jgi:ribose 5-phosphate isomerase RpiB